MPPRFGLGLPTKGVDRVLSDARSGRNFLQTFQTLWQRKVEVGLYFETRASARRLGVVVECSALLRRRADALRVSPLAEFEPFAPVDLYAGVGPCLADVSHDPMQDEAHWPKDYSFALNLNGQSLFPPVLADQVEPKKEHDV